MQRDGGEVVDRFRGRLMIPIARDAGSVVAFGGRATDADQQPKYLNSPETPIYVKSRTLYGLHLTKPAIRQANYAILVEGYFDFAQLVQHGHRAGGRLVRHGADAAAGAAAPPVHVEGRAQLRSRRRGRRRRGAVVRAAGGGRLQRERRAAAQGAGSGHVRPDARPRGYQERLRQSQPYLEFLLDRAAAGTTWEPDEGRRTFLQEMLAVAARIPDAAARDQFADRLAHKARITEDVVRSEIRKAAVARKTVVTDAGTAAAGTPQNGRTGPDLGPGARAGRRAGGARRARDQDLEGLAGRQVFEAGREP